MKNDFRRHDCVANQTLPSRLVDPLSVNFLDVLRCLESRPASGVANKADLLRWTVVRVFGTKVIVVSVFCTKLTVAGLAMKKFRLWIYARALIFAVRMVFDQMTLVVQLNHLFAASLALFENSRLPNV